MKKPKRFKNLPRKKRDQRPHQQAWEFLTRTEVPLQGFPQQTARLATTSALAGSLLLTPAALTYQKESVNKLEGKNLPIHTLAENLEETPVSVKNKDQLLSAQLMRILPPKLTSLSKEQEEETVRILSDTLKIKTLVELEGVRLSTAFGKIGAEQHLRRFPGDTVALHDELQPAGMAVQNGAWGFFATSRESLTDDLKQKEKYYLAVQTFLSPNWSNNSLYLKDWFKYRKMLAINPKTGQAVVGVVADAGPATWTGKNFGGSPEIMAALGLEKIKQGEILLLFVDDPENKIPLGPITI